SQHGTLAPSIIHQRSDFASSMIDGRTVMEISGSSRSTGEIAHLWAYLDDRLHHRQHPTILSSRRAGAASVHAGD
ncbi:MAG: ParA family protein, partial [Gammaproteobacteria bacterium]